jgi:regulator of nucleoside diphosphate kinase
MRQRKETFVRTQLFGQEFKPMRTDNQGVVISDTDFDRLSELLQSPRYRATLWPRLAVLRDELSGGTVIAPAQVPANVVTMRSRVRVRELPRGDAETYTLVYPDEADIARRRVSVLAPLGAALLGARAGSVIEVHAPAGLRRLKVDRIVYQPEAAGDFHL